MTSRPIPFFSSLLAKSNFIVFLLTIIFAVFTISGIAMLTLELYPQIWADKLEFAAAVAISSVLAIIFTLRLAYSPLALANQTLLKMERQNRHDQDAILQLLDEMGDIAEGDLTVSATVSEDITGAIADSINYTIAALRDLVNTINTTTVQVSSAAQETQATAMHLTDASEHQTQQISDVSTAINKLVDSTEQLANNASQSTEIVQQSVQLAQQGAETITNTISGINSVDQYIQQSSGLITHIAERSQEIADIVEHINDIAEQTNILSLNAAIQATMAGEAGRGFSVIVDEIQRLAQHSSKASQQINGLISSIQNDSHEAMNAINQSTAEVASATESSRDTSTSLEQITVVSQQLLSLINTIEAAAKQQSHAVISSSDNINIIQELAIQTSTGSNESTASIGRLLNLTDDLRKSVSGFTLPS